MSAINGRPRRLSQENGGDVTLVVFGDERYARYETVDGYSAVYDSGLGRFCYADVVRGQFVSRGVPVSEKPPFGIRRHLQETPQVRAAKNRSKPSRSGSGARPAMFESFGPNNGLLEGRRVSQGRVKGLTVIVEFEDVRAGVGKAEVSAMLNDDGYRANGNHCSVREYFKIVSSGRLDYSNIVVGPVRLPRKRSYYIKHLFVADVLEQVEKSGFDFGLLDSRKEGIIDAINFMYAGDTEFRGDLWPHNDELRMKLGGHRASYYQLTGLGARPEDLVIGTFCHENGHMLCRFPDMYDYGEAEVDGDSKPSAGIGRYCLMGSGNHNDEGCTPSPVSAYLRHLVGWCPKEQSLNKNGRHEVRHGAYDEVLIYRTAIANEYFIVENRSRLGLDRGLPSSGLAIYHCDILGSNEFQGGTRKRHYQCALLQADGRMDLEKNEDEGDPRDLFGSTPGTAVSDATKPSSLLWDRSESGLIISGVTRPGRTIRFRTGSTQRAPNFESAVTSLVPRSLPAAEDFETVVVPDEPPPRERGWLASFPFAAGASFDLGAAGASFQVDGQGVVHRRTEDLLELSVRFAPSMIWSGGSVRVVFQGHGAEPGNRASVEYVLGGETVSIADDDVALELDAEQRVRAIVSSIELDGRRLRMRLSRLGDGAVTVSTNMLEATLTRSADLDGFEGVEAASEAATQLGDVLEAGEAVPAVSEREACGLADRPIRRESPELTALVRHTNPAIVFKQEEQGAGHDDDLMMTARLRDRLDALAALVSAEWPALKLRVTEAWDGDGEHGPRSLHYEGRAADITVSDRDRAKLGRLARLAVDAGFDWVFFEDNLHVHVSVRRVS